ncbi:MAG: hypothetical protein U0T84_03745 [Chitinophagales bacterium]
MSLFTQRILTLLVFSGLALRLAAGTVVVSNANASSNGTYTTLGAAVTAINGFTQAGRNVTVTISGTCTETASVTLTGAAGVWTSLTITPSGAALVTGNLSGVLFSISGVASVLVDGLNSGGNSLTFENSNTATTASTIYLTNGANKIRFRNCILKGSNTNSNVATGGGLYVLGGSTATLGNNNNSLINCELAPSGTNFPYVGVFAAGTSGKLNTADSIIGCNIHDIFNTTGSLMSAIYGFQATTQMVIYGNSIYQTSAKSTSSSGASRAIFWNVSNGSGLVVKRNIIGGSAPDGSGLTTVTSSAAANWFGIGISSITAGSNVIDSNTVCNVRFTTTAGTAGTAGSGTLIGITTGTAAVQSVSYNTISGLVATSSNTTAAGVVKGIDVASPSGNTMAVEYNIIDSLFSVGSVATVAHSVRGLMSANGGVANIRFNRIGTRYNGSIRAGVFGNSAVIQEASGIYLNGTGATTVTYNEVANVLNVASTGPTATNFNITRGIEVAVSTGAAAISVSNNKVHDIYSAAVNTSSTIFNVVGIGVPINSGPTITLSYDTIYNIVGAFSGTKYIAGIYNRSSTAGTLEIKNCMIYGVRDSFSSGSAITCGIANSGASVVNISNNMITLGIGNTTTGAFNGIYIYGGNPTIIHNSILIGGTGSTASACIATPLLSSFPATCTIKNNILANIRKGATHAVYALGIGSFANLASDYNDLYTATSTLARSGSLLTTNSATIANWRSTSGGDNNSVSVYVLFTDSTKDLHLNTALNCKLSGNAQYQAAYATDIDGQTRPNSAPPAGPDIGADEFNYSPPTISASFTANPVCASLPDTIKITSTAYLPFYTYSGPRGVDTSATPQLIFSSTANTDSGSYAISVNDITGCRVTQNVVLDVDVCTFTWVGNASNAWNTAANWSPAFVPNSCSADVLIPSGTTNAPVISANDVQVGNVQVNDNATLTLSGKNLRVCKNWKGGTSTGATTLGTGRVILESSSGAIISGTTSFNVLRLFTSAGASIGSTASVEIDSVLELQTGTLNNSGTLQFTSTSASKCAVIDHFSAGFTGSISGTVSAQRFVPGSGLWQHYFSTPFSGVAVSQFGASGTPGYIIPTGNCDETQITYGSPYGTFFQYHEDQAAGCALKGWEVVTAGAMDNARGYSTYQNGGAAINVSGTPNLAASYTVNGISNTGWASHTSLQGHTFTAGWNLVGNPYLASLQLQAAAHSSDFNTADVQVWNASGPYAGTYSSYKMSGGAGVNPVLTVAPFQGFMVNKTTAGSGSWVMNSSELVSGNAIFYKTNTPAITLEVSGNGYRDLTRIGFDATATNGFDAQTDALKLHSRLGQPTLYTLIGDQHSSGNVLRELQDGESTEVPLSLEPGANGNFVLSMSGLETIDKQLEVMLEDRQTRTIHHFATEGDYAFTANQSDNWNRFTLHFSKKAVVNGINNQNVKSWSAFMNGKSLMIDTRNWGRGTFHVFNILGQPVAAETTVNNALQALPIEGIAAGYLIIRATSETGEITTRKLVLN